MGVMPLPPAMASTCAVRSVPASSAAACPKRPWGGMTSTVSPAIKPPCTQVEKAPPGTRRTPTRSGSPTAEQME